MESNNKSVSFKSLRQKICKLILICGPWLILINATHSSDRYFLCGPDEDGCFPDIYQYCACIPFNDFEANTSYCLDFDNLSCTPLSQTKKCEPSLVFKNQGECLATIFQSEPNPPCKITTHAFCLENHSRICAQNGQPNSCH